MPLKYTPEGGSVHIYTAETEDYWCGSKGYGYRYSVL